MVEAFQDLGHLDYQIQHALTKHLSDSVLGFLRKEADLNHPNQGWDPISRTHDVVFNALMRQDSADVRGLRKAFAPRVRFRLRDAIAKERRESRTPEHIEKRRQKKTEQADGYMPNDELALDASVEQETMRKRRMRVLAKTVREQPTGTTVSMMWMRRSTSNAFSEPSSDERKRLAFHLFMNGAPYKTKKEHVESIAEALNISERTAREWVKEVRLSLAKNDGVMHLMKSKVGERS